MASDARTRYLLLLAVTPLMVPHVALRAEALVALAASEWSLVCMDSLVDSQVLLL